MKVCIAEKPSVAESIAHILGANRRQGRGAIGYYEGNGYQVTWTFGHLCELKNPEEYDAKWRAWSIVHLPIMPQRFGITLKQSDGVKEQFETIQRLYENAECIINCGDAGQEGELIQRWVMQKAGAIEREKSGQMSIYRLWINSMTDEAIREGFQHLELQQKYDRLYMAGLSRAIGDWLLGMNATRLYTLRYGQTGARQVISIGRVQTPTLAMLVKRHFEIVNFQPQQYWELKTLYRTVTFNSTHGRFASMEEAQHTLEALQGTELQVNSVQKKSSKESPKHLYDLTSLQVDCNRKYGYSAEQTLQLMQSLYEKKVATYPRVDTTYLPDDVYPKCPATLQGLRGYEALTAPLLAPGVKLPKSKQVFDNSKVTDHHAIIPTGHPPVALTRDEHQVFDLIARRFISVFYPDCQYSTITVMADPILPDGTPLKLTFASDEEDALEAQAEAMERAKEGKAPASPDEGPKALFRASNRIIIAPGWRAVYSGQKQDDEEEGEGNGNAQFPDFKKGEHGPHEPSLKEGWTQPPKPYTEANLILAMQTAGKQCEDEEMREAMKANGIGRPSTRAAIIETLLKRRYIRREKKNLVATQTGIDVIKVIHEELLKSPELTGQWERKLRLIESGEYEAAQFLTELKQMVMDIISSVMSDQSNRQVAYVDPEAEKKAAAAAKRAAAAEKRKAAPRKPKEDAASGAAAAGGSTEKHLSLEVPSKCPLCGGDVLRGRTAYGCSNWRTGCTWRLPFDASNS